MSDNYLNLIKEKLELKLGSINFDIEKRNGNNILVDFNNIELERLNNDLEIVYQRLIKGEYKQNDFSGRNKFNIPERTQEFFTYLESYCISGRTWQKLFEYINISYEDKICNLCPGWAPKVELGLYYYGFRGVLEVIDKDSNSIEQIGKFRNLFDYKFSINPIQCDIFSSELNNYKFVIANHVIDDLLLDYYGKVSGEDISSIYKEEIILKSIWSKVVNLDTKYIDEFINNLTNLILKLVDNDGIFLLSQYKSYIEYLLGLDDVTKLCNHIMIRVKENLLKLGFVDNYSVVEQALDGFNGYFNADETCFLIRK